MTIAQRASAARLIAAKGQAVTLTHSAAGAYDTATGTSTLTETEQAGHAVILPFSQGLRHMAGSNITAGDLQCLLSGLTAEGEDLVAPQVGDTLTTAGDETYSIVETSELAPAGLPIIFDLTVRAI